MAYPVEFKMKNNETGAEVTARTRFVIPSWVKTRSELALTHFARIWCEDMASNYFDTQNVTVTLMSVNNIAY